MLDLRIHFIHEGISMSAIGLVPVSFIVGSDRKTHECVLSESTERVSGAKANKGEDRERDPRI
jgi:hypothetical protein